MSTTESEKIPPSLAAKIAKVQLAAEVEHLPKRTVTVRMKKKDGSDGGTYSYDYIEESTLMTKIRPLLAEAGVAVFYSDEIIAINGNMATVKVSLTLIDSESGDTFTMSTEGAGTDSGDKHVNKAKTAAMRYLLWKWFLVPSGDVDPEAENVQRSADVPREQIEFATQEDVDAFLAEVEAAGFLREPSEQAAAAEFSQWEGYRAAWLAAQRRDLAQAKKRQGAGS